MASASQTVFSPTVTSGYDWAISSWAHAGIAGGVLAGLALAAALVVRAVRRHRAAAAARRAAMLDAGESPDEGLEVYTVYVTAMAMFLSVNGMWHVFTETMHLPWIVRLVACTVLESAGLAFMKLARKDILANKAATRHVAIVWAIALLSGALSAGASKSILEGVIRVSLPLLAVQLCHSWMLPVPTEITLTQHELGKRAWRYVRATRRLDRSGNPVTRYVARKRLNFESDLLTKRSLMTGDATAVLGAAERIAIGEALAGLGVAPDALTDSRTLALAEWSATADPDRADPADRGPQETGPADPADPDRADPRTTVQSEESGTTDHGLQNAEPGIGGPADPADRWGPVADTAAAADHGALGSAVLSESEDASLAEAVPSSLFSLGSAWILPHQEAQTDASWPVGSAVGGPSYAFSPQGSWTVAADPADRPAVAISGPSARIGGPIVPMIPDPRHGPKSVESADHRNLGADHRTTGPDPAAQRTTVRALTGRTHGPVTQHVAADPADPADHWSPDPATAELSRTIIAEQRESGIKVTRAGFLAELRARGGSIASEYRSSLYTYAISPDLPSADDALDLVDAAVGSR